MNIHKKYAPDTLSEKTFTAVIMKGNRQIIKREVSASKRFRIDDNSYIIKDKCIFKKMTDQGLKSLSLYREGNPNPFDLENNNTGLTDLELDRLYSEDFHTIIVNIRPDQKSIYMLLLAILNFVLNLAFVIGVGIVKYVI